VICSDVPGIFHPVNYVAKCVQKLAYFMLLFYFNQNCNVSSVFAKTFRQLRGNMFIVVELYADKSTDKHDLANRRIFVTFHFQRVKVLYVKFPTHFTNVITS
jgi:hypothetical protein